MFGDLFALNLPYMSRLWNVRINIMNTKNNRGSKQSVVIYNALSKLENFPVISNPSVVFNCIGSLL